MGHMGEIDRIKREARAAELKYEMDRKIALMGELKPDLINWDNMTDEMLDRHLEIAMEHECYRYVKLLEDKKKERWADSIRKHIRGEK